MSNFSRNIALWVIIALLVLALFNLFQGPGTGGSATTLAYSQFISEVESGQIRDVTIQGNTISGHYTGGTPFNSYAPNDPDMVRKLNQHGVTISAAPDEEGTPTLFAILLNWFPMLLRSAFGFFSCDRCSRVAVRLWALVNPKHGF